MRIGWQRKNQQLISVLKTTAHRNEEIGADVSAAGEATLESWVVSPEQANDLKEGGQIALVKGHACGCFPGLFLNLGGG